MCRATAKFATNVGRCSHGPMPDGDSRSLRISMPHGRLLQLGAHGPWAAIAARFWRASPPTRLIGADEFRLLFIGPVEANETSIGGLADRQPSGGNLSDDGLAGDENEIALLGPGNMDFACEARRRPARSVSTASARRGRGRTPIATGGVMLREASPRAGRPTSWSADIGVRTGPAQADQNSPAAAVAP